MEDRISQQFLEYMCTRANKKTFFRNILYIVLTCNPQTHFLVEFWLTLYILFWLNSV